MSIRVVLLILLCTAPEDTVMVEARSLRPPSSETYVSATINADGNLAILKTNGKTVLIRKEGEQTAFSEPSISPARIAVAAQAMFPNCCTSYDIPLQLVVYAGGKVHRFIGVRLPIFQWGFVDSGTWIAYGQEPVHSACATHYELRDIKSERLIEAIDVPQPCGEIPDAKPVRIPDWVAALISKNR
jgi:hypothetical protein